MSKSITADREPKPAMLLRLLAEAHEELASLRSNNADLLIALESLLGAVQASGMDAYGTITEDAEMAIRKATAP